MNQTSALNTGIISGDATDEQSGFARTGGKTIIVMGIARSGTSMVASLLRTAGVYMGEFMYNVVQEDAEALEFIRSKNTEMLQSFILRRNAAHPLWGFKIPNLHVFLPLTSLSLFRNPHLVVIYRDPVAVAVRNALSEYFEMHRALMGTINALHAQTRFVEQAKCPSLLLSYEKVLAFPEMVVSRLLDFCGIEPDGVNYGALLAEIQPNRPEYLVQATKQYVGNIDGIVDGQLYGWCRQVGSLAPVQLELHVDNKLIEAFVADRFREDLLANEIGNGNHGFFVDLRPYDLASSAVIRVKVSNRTAEIGNSGKTLATFLPRHIPA